MFQASLGFNSSYFYSFVCVAVNNVHAEASGRCWVACFITFHFILTEAGTRLLQTGPCLHPS